MGFTISAPASSEPTAVQKKLEIKIESQTEEIPKIPVRNSVRFFPRNLLKT
jgi:hypothetical protein